MTVLEATVEIVKAVVGPGGAATGNDEYLLTAEQNRKKFLQGIEELYGTLKKLHEE